MTLDPSAAGRWLAATSGRAGLAVLALTVPFAIWVFTSVDVDDPEAAQTTPRGAPADEIMVSSLWWMPFVVLVLFAGLVWRHRVGTAGDADTHAFQEHALHLTLLAFGAAGVCAAAVPFDALPWTAGSPEDFVSSARATGLWMVAVLTAVGMFLFLGSLASSAQRSSQTLVGLPAGALAVLVAALLIQPLAAYRPIIHSWLDQDPGQAVSVPTDITRVGWTWRPPEHTVVEQVRAGTHGPVIVLNDGLVALDGHTGHELWTYRAPYSPLWGAGVFDNSAEYAYMTLESEEETQAPHRVLLDTATGQVVEQGRFSREVPASYTWWDTGRPYLTPEITMRSREGVLTVSGPQGDLLWERPVGEHDPSRSCLVDTGSVLPHRDQVFIGEMCADRDPAQEPAWSGLDFGERLDEARKAATVSVVALDVVTGEENWRREWRARAEESPPTLLLGGHARPGATPVILTEERVLDATTGQDSLLDLPEDLLHIDQFGIVDSDSVLHADGAGAVMVEHGEPDDSTDPFVVHHADATGRVVDTTVLENSDTGHLLSQGIPLRDVLVGGGIDFTAGQGVPTVVVGELYGEVTQENTRQIALDTVLVDEGWDGWSSHSHRLVPVPGAVVSYLDLEDDPEGRDLNTVYGLVP